MTPVETKYLLKKINFASRSKMKKKKKKKKVAVQKFIALNLKNILSRLLSTKCRMIYPSNF
jgi:hypothetical protein